MEKNQKRKIFSDKSNEKNPGGGVKRSKKLQSVKPKPLVHTVQSDDEVVDKNVEGTNICLVCGEFGKNNEWWLRCVVCSNWAHKDCTDGCNEKRYICEFCT
ncbi:hypothetical protein QE152_g4069 [Popillia japonica]|uniref:Uncharacterized protein n=1 Tax=Popillia japonica TaxID=7064 RepID=A0AAW1N279_POPJA